MKANTIKAYTDKNDGSVHLIGETVNLTEDRFLELAAKGFVEAEEKPAADDGWQEKATTDEKPDVEAEEKPAAKKPRARRSQKAS